MGSQNQCQETPQVNIAHQETYKKRKICGEGGMT